MGHESPPIVETPDSVNGLHVKMTVLGDCGRIHPSFEDWQKCAECERILKHNLFLSRMLTAQFPLPHRDTTGA